MTLCTHHLLDAPTGLRCTREQHPGNGHVYTSTTGSFLGEGDGHLEPNGDSQ
jgi:hypothetical protein